MGALYEDVERFFGDIFAVYGRFVARHPVVFVVIALLTSILLGLGILNMQSESDVELLYTPMGSRAALDRAYIAQLYPDTTRESFYPHQLVYPGTYGQLLLSAKGGHVLTESHFKVVRQLYRTIQKITLDEDDRGLQYRDLCALRSGKCLVDGRAVLDVIDERGCINGSQGFPFMTEASGYKLDLRDILGGIETESRTDNGAENDQCSSAKVLRLKFNLRHDTDQQRALSLLWERAFLRVLSGTSRDTLDVSYAASESLDMELARHLSQDTKFFSFTFVIMVLYAMFVSSGGNWVSTRILLAQAGILSAMLAILASFGLLSLCGIVFVDICGVMPFLILGIGVDSTFILMSGWRQTDIRHSVEDRMAAAFRSSAISVTITSLTNLLAFCIGATSPFLSVRNFCIYAGVAVWFCYLNHLTLFAGCMVLHARRVEASRHCVTCVRTTSREALVAARTPRKRIFCCHGHPPKRAREEDSLCERIPNTVLPRLLLKWQVKLTVVLMFAAYVGISIWGASKIKTGIKIESVVPESSYMSKYFAEEKTFFPKYGPAIMFVITEPQQYDNSDVQNKIQRMISQAHKSGYTDEQFSVSWLHAYLQSTDVRKRRNFVEDVKTNFLPNRPEYINDIKFNSENDVIETSRVYVRSRRLNSSGEEGDMMMKMREIASNSTLPVIAYSPQFIFSEHYVSILKNTLLSVGIAFIGMIFITLMFIPHPVSIICVTVSMVTIVLGMFGFMSFWDMELSAITNVQIILSVGFCVDFTVHINHSFLTAPGKNRKERVVSALERVGIPILNGAVSSLLGVLILAFAHSYVFRSFFKTMLLVISLGLAHALLLLPVVLSFVGPKRTSKPRVFIPISNHWSNTGVSGFFSPSKQHKHQSRDALCDTADSSLHKPSKHEDIELMNMESPAENKAILQSVPETEEPTKIDPETSTSVYAVRTLLDKTSDEEHYKEPVKTSDFTFESKPSSTEWNASKGSSPTSTCCREATGPNEVLATGANTKNRDEGDRSSRPAGEENVAMTVEPSSKETLLKSRGDLKDDNKDVKEYMI